MLKQQRNIIFHRLLSANKKIGKIWRTGAVNLIKLIISLTDIEKVVVVQIRLLTYRALDEIAESIFPDNSILTDNEVEFITDY